MFEEKVIEALEEDLRLFRILFDRLADSVEHKELAVWVSHRKQLISDFKKSVLFKETPGLREAMKYCHQSDQNSKPWI